MNNDNNKKFRRTGKSPLGETAFGVSQLGGLLIIFSAPSGSGKSTLVNHVLTCGFNLSFSVSATSRAPRGKEEHGKEYYFLSADEFRGRITRGDFLEYEEVYAGCFYGTLKSEVERILSEGKNVIFDVDVVGGLNIKSIYKEKALSIFVAPPSIETLKKRLAARATDSPEKIEERIKKAGFEMSFAPQFDVVIVNDDLEKAKAEAEEKVSGFLKQTAKKRRNAKNK
jgi:guanylate kinase